MKADKLTSWDSLELARILASEYAEAEDLAEAFPSINKVENFDFNSIPEFVQKHWRFFLASFDFLDLVGWRSEKDQEDKRDEIAMDEYDDYCDEWLEELCIKILEISSYFRCMDLAERCGFPPKRKSS